MACRTPTRLTDEERAAIRGMSKDELRLFSSIHAGGDYGDLGDVIAAVVFGGGLLAAIITGIVLWFKDVFL